MAFMSGVLQPAANTKYEWPSGKCTWPTFQSLGFCSSCMEAASPVSVSCKPLKLNKLTQEGIASNASLCAYRLLEIDPNSTFIPADAEGDNDDGDDDDGESEFEFWTVWAHSLDGLWYPTTWLNMTGGPASEYTVLASFASARFNTSYVDTGPGAPHDILPAITRCKPTWCVHTYASSKFENGQLYDLPTSSVTLSSNKSHCARLAMVYPLDTPPASFLGDLDSLCHAQRIPNDTYWIDEDLDLYPTVTSTLEAKVFIDADFSSLLELLPGYGLYQMTAFNVDLPASFRADYAGLDSTPLPSHLALYFANNAGTSPRRSPTSPPA